ncbi:MAG TPA: glycosyltransferase family 2 protein [Actinomycetota bacterium]|nr:glycosyltransferase family 2 protein [Actinomycetota bacterium]
MSEKLTYVLPFKAGGGEDLDDLTAYLQALARVVDVIVVDGSEGRAFERHADLWSGYATHVPPRDGLGFANGKVDGVITGVEIAASEKVVVADEDVRYEVGALQRTAELLDSYDLVRPQNYFDPMPWHALWDTGRTLLNRAFAADYPGTLGVRRSVFLDAGGYDGDAMFENLEMIRTIEEAGGSSTAPLDLYVRRLPPDAAQFWAQRTRQAYDDLAQPWRLATFAALGPAAVVAARWRPALLAAGVGAIVGLAETGRRKGGGTRVFPVAASLMAPLWVVERAACTWVALVHRMLGGIPYRGSRLKVAANSRRTIRRRLAERSGRSRR